MKLLRRPIVAGTLFGYATGVVESARPSTIPEWVLLAYFASFGLVFVAFFVPYMRELAARSREEGAGAPLSLHLEPPRWSAGLALFGIVVVWGGFWLSSQTTIPELPRPAWLSGVSWPYLLLASFYSLLSPVILGWKPHAV